MKWEARLLRVSSTQEDVPFSSTNWRARRTYSSCWPSSRIEVK
jgi:hypothetical protein